MVNAEKCSNRTLATALRYISICLYRTVKKSSLFCLAGSCQSGSQLVKNNFKLVGRFWAHFCDWIKSWRKSGLVSLSNIFFSVKPKLSWSQYTVQWYCMLFVEQTYVPVGHIFIKQNWSWKQSITTTTL